MVEGDGKLRTSTRHEGYQIIVRIMWKDTLRESSHSVSAEDTFEEGRRHSQTPSLGSEGDVSISKIMRRSSHIFSQFGISDLEKS
jgi:hypothetical protein